MVMRLFILILFVFINCHVKANAMPVEMVRALLTNEKLSKNFETSWRFYNNELNRQSMKKY